MFDKQKIKEYTELIQKQTQDKYNRPGIYCIKIDNKIVYIGKSRNVLDRIACHLCNINKDSDEWKSHKYDIIREAMENSLSIGFDLLEGDIETEQELGEREGYWIRKFMPPLNRQIPKEEDYRRYSTNKKASIISLSEVMGTSE